MFQSLTIDEKHCWIFKSYSNRDDNLVCAAVVMSSAIVIKTLMTHYYPEDDILEIHLNEKPVAREISYGWNVNISYAVDGSICEIVILEARETGLYPISTERRAA